MDKIVQEILIREVHTQCVLVLLANDDLNKYLDRLEAEVKQGNMERFRPGAGVVYPASMILYYLQSLIVSAANVSKALWGQNDRSRKQREPVRRHFAIDDTSPLASRAMRNHFEHFDERVEAWRKKNPMGGFMDMNVSFSDGPSGKPAAGTTPSGGVWRCLYAKSGIVIFEGDAFNWPDIAKEAHRLLQIK